MKTKSKIWLGVGAFALVQAADVTMQAGRPSFTLAQPALAAERGECGWHRNEGQWKFKNCERGERYHERNERSERWKPRGERGERWNERGERWNDYNKRWDKGERGYR